MNTEDEIPGRPMSLQAAAAWLKRRGEFATLPAATAYLGGVRAAGLADRDGYCVAYLNGRFVFRAGGPR